MGRERIVICISGFAATGKTTLAKKLAEVLNLKYVSGGDALQQLAIEKGYKPGGPDWWETEEGLRFLNERLTNPEFDKQVDAKLLEIASKENVVADSWVLPWFLKDGYKIWLKASEEERIMRLMKRSGLSYEEAKRILRKRDEESKQIYKELYGISIGEEFEPFNLVLDTTGLSEDEVFKATLFLVKLYFKI